MIRSFLFVALLTAAAHAVGAAPEVALDPAGDFQAAPHGGGNAYAPDIVFDDGVYRM